MFIIDLIVALFKFCPLIKGPKVQVADYSSDDQLADRSEMRSLERASSEVDHSSVRQLLREGELDYQIPAASNS